MDMSGRALSEISISFLEKFPAMQVLCYALPTRIFNSSIVKILGIEYELQPYL